jgi:uncharacterized protein involved in exopolysaccharide biosynthesis
LTKYLDIFFHHLIAFLVVMVVAPLGISVVLILRYPTASAAAALWSDNPTYLGVGGSEVSNWNQYLTPAQNTADIMSQIVQTGTFGKQVARQLDSQHVWQNDLERSDTLGQYDKSLKVTPAGSHLVAISFTCPRADLCVKVLQTTISLYQQTLDQQQQQQAKAASAFYQQQLQQAQQALQSDQNALEAYLVKNPSLRSPTAGSQTSGSGQQPSTSGSAQQPSTSGSGSQSSTNGTVPAQLAQLSQQVTTDQNNVQNLQGKLDAARFNSSAAYAINNSAIKVVDKPTAFPQGMLGSLPKQKLAITWAACLGLGLATLLALGWLDRTAGDARDVQKALDVPVLAQIPHLESGTRL